MQSQCFDIDFIESCSSNIISRNICRITDYNYYSDPDIAVLPKYIKQYRRDMEIFQIARNF